MSVIKFKSNNDKEYTLEFNRQSLVEMEKLGFSFNDIGDKVVTSATLMMYGALQKNHKSTMNVAEQVLDEMLLEYPLDDILTNLTEMITEVFQSGGKKKIVRQ